MTWHAMRRSLVTLLTVLLLSLAFAGYLRPGFVVDLANQLWLCL